MAGARLARRGAGYAAPVAPDEENHRIAVFRQDNGELSEDVVSREVAEGGEGGEEEGATTAERPPADDPESRVVHSEPVEGTDERPHPEAPVPGTLAPRRSHPES